MGIRLVVEVLDHAPATLSHRERMLLVVLAEEARDETRLTWNSVQSPQNLRRAKLSRTQLYEVLKELLAQGAIEKVSAGQKNGVAKYRILPQHSAERNSETGTQSPAPQDAEHGQRPVHRDPDGTFSVPPSRTLNESQCPAVRDFSVPSSGTPTPQLLKAVSTQAADGPGFDEFYAVFPRKVGKGAARKAWAAAMKRGVDPNHILAAAQRYRDSPVRVPHYTKHPGPWLNDERYDDEPDTLPLAPAGPPRPAHETNADRGVF